MDVWGVVHMVHGFFLYFYIFCFLLDTLQRYRVVELYI